MDPDQPSQSPFASGSREVSSAEATIAPTPDPYQGAEPRLGIIHLLVWTACVAFLLGINQSFPSSLPQAGSAARLAMGMGFQSLGNGAALAGLLLWGWRRYGGRAFPRFPGEYFLVILGVISALSIPSTVIEWFLAASTDSAGEWAWIAALMGWGCAYGLVAAIAYLVAAVHMKARRRRAVFLLCLGIGILRWSAILLTHGTVAWHALGFIADAIVGTALWLDWRDRLRYPWPHWLGIAVLFWGTIGQLTWLFLR